MSDDLAGRMLDWKDRKETLGDQAAAAMFCLPQEGPDDPRPILRRLVQEEETFAELRTGEPTIMTVFRCYPLARQGKSILGQMALPQWQGSMGPLAVWLLAKTCGGVVPDYIMILDQDWWDQASATRREALVFHELCHCAHARDKDGELRFTDEGRPVWGIAAHDVEEFNAVVEKYGAWTLDLVMFLDAAKRGVR